MISQLELALKKPKKFFKSSKFCTSFISKLLNWIFSLKNSKVSSLVFKVRRLTQGREAPIGSKFRKTREQFHYHCSSSFCTNRLTLIFFMVHGIECRGQKLGITSMPNLWILLKLGAVLLVNPNGNFYAKLHTLCANLLVKLTPGL